jgi:hypothetical protein
MLECAVELDGTLFFGDLEKDIDEEDTINADPTESDREFEASYTTLILPSIQG